MSVLMKPSGVEWIGDVPEGWTYTIIKRYYEIQLGKMLQPQQSSSKDTEEYYLRSANLAWEGIKLTNVKKMWFKPFEKINYSIQYGDLLISEGGDVGRSTIWYNNLENCYFQNAINRVRARHNNDTKFLYYWMYMLKNSGYIDAIVSRITIAHLTAEKLERLPFLCPLPSEQKSIATFLDKSTSKIEDAIKTKQAQLKTLESLKKSIIHKAVTKGLDESVVMKDSGIEWIGEIPVHWKIQKLKRTTSIKGRIGWQGLTSDEYRRKGKHLLVTGTDFKGRYINWNTCHFIDEERYDEDTKIQLIEKDVLVTKDGTIGKISIAKDIPFPTTLNTGVFVTRPIKNDYIQEYMYWVLASDMLIEFIEYSKVGSTIAHIYQKTFERFIYPLPPIKEQQPIVDFLDEETQKIITLKQNVKNQINKLKQYKKSLIYEYVTGKKQVKG